MKTTIRYGYHTDNLTFWPHPPPELRKTLKRKKSTKRLGRLVCEFLYVYWPKKKKKKATKRFGRLIFSFLYLYWSKEEEEKKTKRLGRSVFSFLYVYWPVKFLVNIPIAFPQSNMSAKSELLSDNSKVTGLLQFLLTSPLRSYQ